MLQVVLKKASCIGILALCLGWLAEPQQSIAAGSVTVESERRENTAPREQNSGNSYYNSNNGYNGYIGTYKDKETGDTITTIIAPRAPQQQMQQSPMVIMPQVGGGYYPPHGGYPNYPSYPSYPVYPGYPVYPDPVDPGFSRPPYYPGGGIPPTWWRGVGK